MNKPLTQQEFDAIAARAAGATPAPWRVEPDSRPDVYCDSRLRSGYFGDGGLCTFSKYGEAWGQDYENLTDAEFVAHAREDIPALLAEVARLWKLQEPSQPDRHWSDDSRHSAGE